MPDSDLPSARAFTTECGARPPFMSRSSWLYLLRFRASVVFWGYEEDGSLAGVMGIQSVRDVDLIRHAYVLPSSQRRGIGGALLGHLRQSSTRRILIGTWEAADWAIRFYIRHGFELVGPARKTVLLKAYWDVPDRQMEVSVILANPPLDET